MCVCVLMKKLTVRVNADKAKDLTELLEEHIYYESREDDIVKLVAYIPDDCVDDLLTELHKRIDLRYKKNIIEVSAPSFVVSSVLSKADKKKGEEEKTPVEELLGHAHTYYHFDRDKIVLIAIASIIALVGLFQNNVTIVIGAMLLAPFIGPIYAFTINTAVGKGAEALRNLSQVGLYIFISFVISAMATTAASMMHSATNMRASMRRANVRSRSLRGTMSSTMVAISPPAISPITFSKVRMTALIVSCGTMVTMMPAVTAGGRTAAAMATPASPSEMPFEKETTAARPSMTAMTM